MVKAYEKKSLRRTLSRVRRDVRAGKKTKRASISKKDATIVLAQGVSAAPRRNFGTKNVSQCKNGESVRACIASLDARVPTTIGLPRAVGPYTVMRTSKLIGSSRDLIMFCPFYRSHSDATPNAHGWYSWCGVQSVNSALAVNDPHNTEPVTMPLSFLGAAAEVVPAAMTVQVMNPAAIQGADGIFAMARVNQQLDLGRTTTNWFDMKDRFISFYSPRLLSAGKLALRGVKVDSYPLDMSEYSNFAPIVSHSTPFQWNGVIKPAALAPIVFMQNNVSPVEIQFMVTIEWRVRFDPANPATASHTHHDTTSDSTWNSVIKTMSSVGHGVEELAEGVTAIGSLARGAARLAGA